MKNFSDIVTAEHEVVDFPADQYIKEVVEKKQIVLHHTASGRGADGDINWWKNSKSRIATSIIIDWTGKLFQCFSSKYWGYHLGVKNSFIKEQGVYKSASHSKLLNMITIGIEIDAWGQLKLIDGEYRAYPYKFGTDGSGKKVVLPKDRVQHYPDGFKGYNYYEKYTDAQIESTRQLILWWHEVYDIPLDYCYEEMFQVSKLALSMEKGIFTHNSYRPDKTDIHPQPEMLKMLSGLKPV